MATLKIRDLSIGDWVDYCGRHYKVYSIEECGFIRAKCEDDYTSSHIGKNIDYLEPIPITAEILEKNGFTRRSGDFPIYEYITLHGKMLRTIMVSLDHPYSYIVCRIEDTSKEKHELDRIPVNLSVDRNPIYIHDLQHALRLAGVRKEINL